MTPQIPHAVLRPNFLRKIVVDEDMVHCEGINQRNSLSGNDRQIFA